MGVERPEEVKQLVLSIIHERSRARRLEIEKEEHREDADGSALTVLSSPIPNQDREAQ